MKYVITFFAGFIIASLLINSCSEKQTIKTAEIINQVTDTLIKHDTIFKPFEVPKWYKDTEKEKELKLELSERDFRIKNYEKEFRIILDDYNNSDSILKSELFKRKLSLKSFETIKEDSLIIINTKGIVSGEVKEISTYYKIKSQKIEVPIRQKKFSLSAGIGSDFQATTPVLKAGVGFQNYELDFLKINGVNYGTITYRVRLNL